MLRPEGHPVLAAILDTAMAPMATHRARLVPRAHGRVVEIGMGTGANLPYYRDVTEVVGVEPDPHMRRRALERAAACDVPVTVVDASASDLPFPDASFDSAVATWVLCTIPDPDAAARELRRVLKPGGTLVFAEHTVSPHPAPRAVQQLLTPAWKRIAGGCHLDRDGLGILERAGFVLDVDPHPGAGWSLTPVFRGTAG